MKRLVALLTAAMAVILVVAAPAAARKIDGAQTGGSPLTAVLNGANEVTPGDPDGTGTMHLSLNQGQGEICWDLAIENVDNPARAHIHRGEAGVNGPVVVFFFDLVVSPPIPVEFVGCTDVDPDLIKEIRQNPSQFYINVHNADFPAGAVRGQLARP